MSRRRPYAVAIYKHGRRYWYGFPTRGEAERFRLRHVHDGYNTSPVLHLRTKR